MEQRLSVFSVRKLKGKVRYLGRLVSAFSSLDSNPTCVGSEEIYNLTKDPWSMIKVSVLEF